MNMTHEEIKANVERLKKETNAVVVAHTYQQGDVQDLADKTGDSYALSKFVSEVDNDVIVFCGVKFMAESAKILAPDKTVLLPVLEAGCPMANMVNGKDIQELRIKYPKAAVVCYINSTAEVKANSDVCVTSSNAMKVVSSLEEEEIIFVPDKNLGGYIAKQLPDKKIILWDGYCIVHNQLTRSDILKWKKMKPEAVVLAHPECTEEVLSEADFIGSTKAIIEHVLNTNEKSYIIATEKGVAHPIKKLKPDSDIIFPSSCLLCVNMKKTNPIDVYNSLNEMKYEIELDEITLNKAKRSLERMLELS